MFVGLRELRSSGTTRISYYISADEHVGRNAKKERIAMIMTPLKDKGEKMLVVWLFVALMVVVVATISSTSSTGTHELVSCVPSLVEEETGHAIYSLDIEDIETEKETLGFYTVHQYAKVFADGEPIYELSQTGEMWGHTTGRVWNFVLIPVDTKEITIEFTACYSDEKAYAREFYIGSGDQMTLEIIRDDIVDFVVCLLVVVAGVFLIFYWKIVGSGAVVSESMFFLGILAILIGTWQVNETDVTAILWTNRPVSSFLAHMLLMSMPIPFAMFTRSFLEMKDNKFWKIFCDISALETVVVTVMHISGVYEFRKSIWLTHTLIAAVMVYMLVSIMQRIAKGQVDHRLKACIGALLLVSAAIIADLAQYYSGRANTGAFVKFAFFVFIVILGVESSRDTLAAVKKGHRAEELEAFALSDSMTGLYNRNAYDRYLSNENEVRAGFANGCMVVTFDLNDLKHCNDTYGHGAGDEYIIQASSIIESVFEKYGKCYRIGGDEFCCIIYKPSGCNIKLLVHKMHKEVERLNNKRIIPMKGAIACGYAYMEMGDAGIEDVRARADEMMYQDKARLKEKR